MLWRLFSVQFSKYIRKGYNKVTVHKLVSSGFADRSATHRGNPVFSTGYGIIDPRSSWWMTKQDFIDPCYFFDFIVSI
jgi:hypothetical protein